MDLDWCTTFDIQYGKMNNYRFRPSTEDVIGTLEELSILYSEKAVERKSDGKILLPEVFRPPLNKLFKYLETVDMET